MPQVIEIARMYLGESLIQSQILSKTCSTSFRKFFVRIVYIRLPTGNTTKNNGECTLSIVYPFGAYQRDQSFRGKPGTRVNSFVLLVTSVLPRLKAWAAISMSSGPMGVPLDSNAVRN